MLKYKFLSPVGAIGMPSADACGTGEKAFPAFNGGAPTELKDGIIKKPAFF